jgi:hypothetical protein
VYVCSCTLILSGTVAVMTGKEEIMYDTLSVTINHSVGQDMYIHTYNFIFIMGSKFQNHLFFIRIDMANCSLCSDFAMFRIILFWIIYYIFRLILSHLISSHLI